MRYGGDEMYSEFDAQWIVGGPDSGGVRYYLLWQGHLFYVERDHSSSSIGHGVSIADFIAHNRGSSSPEIQQIVADLEARAP